MEGPPLAGNERCAEATVCFSFFFFPRMQSSFADFDSQHGRLHLEVEDAKCFGDRNSKQRVALPGSRMVYGRSGVKKAMTRLLLTQSRQPGFERFKRRIVTFHREEETIV